VAALPLLRLAKRAVVKTRAPTGSDGAPAQ
jgi:hypothetical protein